MMKKINIGIIGYGNIGSAVARNLRRNRELIARNTGLDLQVKKICETRKIKVPYPVTRSAQELINDPAISVIVECVGGVKPALQLILAALKKGKDVVTPNKEVIAKHLGQILAAARQGRSRIMFEGSVGGGIPIILPLRESLAGNRIEAVYGIVNGTTNYILSRMMTERMEFAQALKQAQQKGYAEPDPTADIEGHDAAYKAAILAAVAFGVEVDVRDVQREGITGITQEDIQYAGEIGYVIKLLAVARLNAGKLEVRVHPALVSRVHPLASVADNFNAIYIKGQPIGQLMFYGPGAGGDPTSSAIISDIIQLGKGGCRRIPRLKKARISQGTGRSRYYIRLQAPDRFGVLAGISRAFARKKVSIAAVVQKETVGNLATIVILLDQVPEKNLRAALKVVRRLPVVRRICSVIRIVS